jgi:hypothetical protein
VLSEQTLVLVLLLLPLCTWVFSLVQLVPEQKFALYPQLADTTPLIVAQQQLDAVVGNKVCCCSVALVVPAAFAIWTHHSCAARCCAMVAPGTYVPG